MKGVVCWFEGRDDFPCLHPGVPVCKNNCDCTTKYCTHSVTHHHPNGDRTGESFPAHRGCNSGEVAAHPRNRYRQPSAKRSAVGLLMGKALKQRIEEDPDFREQMRETWKAAGIKSSSQRISCPQGCGMVTIPMAMGRHLKYTHGIQPKKGRAWQINKPPPKPQISQVCWFEGNIDFPCLYPGLLVVHGNCDCGYQLCSHYPTIHHLDGDRTAKSFPAHHGCNAAEARKHPRNFVSQQRFALDGKSGHALAQKMKEDPELDRRIRSRRRDGGFTATNLRIKCEFCSLVTTPAAMGGHRTSKHRILSKNELKRRKTRV